jgi:hypothetical protein
MNALALIDQALADGISAEMLDRARLALGVRVEDEADGTQTWSWWAPADEEDYIDV